jgi:uncharacterized protein YkwD
MLPLTALRTQGGPRSCLSRSAEVILFLLLVSLFTPAANAPWAQESSKMKLVSLVPDNGSDCGNHGREQNPPRVQKPGCDPEILASQQRQVLLELINQLRRSYKLPAFRYVVALEASALRHSSDMAQHHFISHTGSDGSSPAKRMLDARYRFRSSAENIAAGLGSAQDVLKAWMDSPQHRANLLNGSLRELGVGYAYVSGSPYRHYWTLDLGCQ